MDLQADATIADVVGSLNKPAEYVRLVLHNMWDCKRQHGEASVRIGITGKGRTPHYLIEYHNESLSDPAVFGIYRGSSHKELEGLGKWNYNIVDLLEGKPIEGQPPEHWVEEGHWSSRAMTLDEVSKLLLQLRSKTR